MQPPPRLPLLAAALLAVLASAGALVLPLQRSFTPLATATTTLALRGRRRLDQRCRVQAHAGTVAPVPPRHPYSMVFIAPSPPLCSVMATVSTNEGQTYCESGGALRRGGAAPPHATAPCPWCHCHQGPPPLNKTLPKTKDWTTLFIGNPPVAVNTTIDTGSSLMLAACQGGLAAGPQPRVGVCGEGPASRPGAVADPGSGEGPASRPWQGHGQLLARSCG